MRVSRVGSFVPGVVALLSLLVAAAGPLEAQQTILMGTVRNEEGEPVNAAQVSVLGTPAPTAVLTQKPQHGTVRMQTRKAAAVYGPGPYEHCDGKVGKALAFEYTSAPDYRGRDSFEVRVRYSDGEIRHGRYEVEVR